MLGFAMQEKWRARRDETGHRYMFFFLLIDIHAATLRKQIPVAPARTRRDLGDRSFRNRIRYKQDQRAASKTTPHATGCHTA
ncbi:hypothetical protein DY251_20305 [Mesorhizobium denitrificans]|uniref:Uncharacterized protein n=1 Tax=Mesorhizobium denitrificans TaxID=2294114 RepID=A0A371X3W6_9HYPH|nr:hypothetical protein DY251_20305 [Mesorhizobium denitrificans]